MDFRNKYLIITVRSLFGLALTALGVLGLFMAMPTEGLSPAMAAALQGMNDLGITKLLAAIELVSGLFSYLLLLYLLQTFRMRSSKIFTCCVETCN